MEERLRNVENFARISAEMTVIIEESQRQSEEWRLRSEEWQRRSEEWQRGSEERQRLVEESQRRRGELLQQLVQAVAVIQAEIVRIDETHS